MSSKYKYVSEDPCHKCGGFTRLGIPDSLAAACTSCGAITVDGEPCGSLQEWARDIYEMKQERTKGNIHE